MHTFVHEIDSIKEFSFKYSICTLVTNKEEYAEMVDSFIKAGFEELFCEYLYVDNSATNKYEAYLGINKFLSAAKGKYIIVCHQDILLNHDRIDKLEKCIDAINKQDPDWGILGNAGGVDFKKNVYKVGYKSGEIHTEGSLPAKVKSLDENFLLIKNEANLALSHDLTGYHLYGADLCLIARVIGYNAYVIDFLLTHKSLGNPDASFYKLKERFLEKYQRAFKGIFIKTTITRFFISGSPFKSFLYNTKPVEKLVSFYYKIIKR
jgi:hypothetical protein